MNSLYRTTFRRIASAQNTSSRLFPAVQLGASSNHQPPHQHAWMATSTTKKKSSRKKNIKGTRGSRGHGWYLKYRSGRGGRSLQGEYWDRTQQHWDMQQWNDAVFALGSQYVYLDIAVEPPAGEGEVKEAAAVAKEEEDEEIDISVEAAGEGEEQEEAAAAATETETTEKEEENDLAAEESSDDSPAQEEEEKEAVTPTVKEQDPIKIERLIIQVASTVLPETCINFIGLCQEAAYKDSLLYRIEKQVGICGGDVVTNTGKTGQCWQSFPPYSNGTKPRPRPSPLRHDLPPEEPLALWHTAGMVTMLCAKVNEIDSRFLLCGKDAFHLDGIHRAFGKMSPESLAIVQDWQANVLTMQGRPKGAILRIVDCGVLEDYDPETASSSTEEAVAAEESAEATIEAAGTVETAAAEESEEVSKEAAEADEKEEISAADSTEESPAEDAKGDEAQSAESTDDSKSDEKEK